MNEKPHAMAVTDTGGPGKVLVFLHGFCENKEIWTPYTRPLQEKYRLIMLDLPGHGQNNAPRAAYSMADNAEFVLEALRALQIEQCVLIGHSMGGYTALAFAEKYPAMLTGIGLFHSSALADGAEKKENRNKTIQFIQKHGVDKFMDTFVAPLFYESNRQPQQVAIRQLTQTGKELTPAAVIGTIQGMRDRPDRTHVLSQADFPFLFIAGKQDTAVTLEQTLQQCYLPKTAYTLFLDATGHMGMFERPQETLAAIQSFAALS